MKSSIIATVYCSLTKEVPLAVHFILYIRLKQGGGLTGIGGIYIDNNNVTAKHAKAVQIVRDIVG